MKLAIAAFFLALSIPCYGQHTVKIKVTGIPVLHDDEPVFITGAFNRWSPDSQPAALTRGHNGQQEITLKNIKAGLMEYKFTRGSWKTLESTKVGRLVNPRSAIITRDTTISCVIAGWRDDFPESTASPQVRLMDSAMYVPQLSVSRRIWVYLPKGYDSSKKRYPVLYMHDGQDIFDEATSEGRIGPLEWGVDETIDQSKNPCIVIAIAHDQDKSIRIQEYYVNPNPDYKVVMGSEYLDFIVTVLKPMVDKKYKTLPDKNHTFMAGGSMGGLITFYAGLRYPEVFGALGVLSPSLWLDYGNAINEIDTLKKVNQIKKQRYFFYAGKNENRIKPDSSVVRMNDDVQLAADKLEEKAGPTVRRLVNPEGRHGAWYWRSAFVEFYKWLMD